MSAGRAPASPAAMAQVFADGDHSVAELVARFERCALLRSEWTHRAHLTVALAYLARFSRAEGSARMRHGIHRLNAALGIEQTPTGGYHETITTFYLWLVWRFLEDAAPGASLSVLADDLFARYGDRELPLRHYSRERLMSWEARTTYVEPDLAELEL